MVVGICSLPRLSIGFDSDLMAKKLEIKSLAGLTSDWRRRR